MTKNNVDEYERHGCEFKNEDECEEELDESMGWSYQKADDEHNNLEEQYSSNSGMEISGERDEDKYEGMVRPGFDKPEAAHIVNAQKSKELRDKEFMGKRTGDRNKG